MKKGKSVKLNLYQSIKSTYGTVNSKNLKSIFINIQSWVNPKKECENWVRVVNFLKKDIKCCVLESLNDEIFKEHIIIDLDLRTSGISLNKKSFFNLEINLYTKSDIDFRSHTINESVKKIIKTVYKENILNNNHFEFSPSKKDFEYNL
jgi:hypothetical protein